MCSGEANEGHWLFMGQATGTVCPVFLGGGDLLALNLSKCQQGEGEDQDAAYQERSLDLRSFTKEV